MKIERLRLAGVGGFRETRELTFPDKGAAIVAGTNESGRTAVAWAIYGAFFGLPSRASSYLSNPAWVEVRFAARGKRFELRRDFHSQDVVLSELAGQKKTVLLEGRTHRAADEEALREALEARTGLSDGTVWLQSGAVIDGEVETRLGRSVRSWLGMSAAGPETALSRLKARLDRLTSGEDQSPGQIESVRDELVRAREELTGREERDAEVRATRERLGACEIARKEAQDAVAAQERTLDTLRGFEDLSRERSRMEEDILRHRKDRDRIRQHVEEVEQLEDRLERYFTDFLDAPDDIEEIIQNFTDLYQKLESREREREHASGSSRSSSAHTKRNGCIAGGAAGLFGSLGCMGAGAPVLAFILGPLLAGGGFAVVWHLDRVAKRNRIKRHLSMAGLTVEIDDLRRQVEDARANLGKLGRYKDPTQLRREVRRYMQARSELDKARSVRDSHPQLSEAVNAYEEVFTELQVLDTQIREMVATARFLSGLDASTERMAREFDKTRTKGEEAKARFEALGSEMRSLEASLAKTASDHRHAPRLREDIALLEARDAELSFAAGALALAAEAMESAIGAYQDADVDRLAARAGQHLSTFTKGQHDRVRWTVEMEAEVHTPGTGWHSVERLSVSARDQLHLALRLAVSQERPPEDSFPVLLDGAFLRWDDDRLELARAALARVGEEGRQVIVLTGDSRVACWERHTLKLEAPAHETERHAA